MDYGKVVPGDNMSASRPETELRIRPKTQHTGSFCCVVWCSNRRGRDKANKNPVKRSYYCFPKDEWRKKLWIKAIRRAHWTPNQYTRICSDHFHGGLKTNDPETPGYIPCIFPTQSTRKHRTTQCSRTAGSEKLSTLKRSHTILKEPELEPDYTPCVQDHEYSFGETLPPKMVAPLQNTCMMGPGYKIVIEMTDTTSKAVEAPKVVPLFSFGILADVQYANIANKQNFEKTAWRCYRQSINILRDAVHKWNSSAHPISFILQLGDLIDGFNTLSNSSHDALAAVQEVLAEFKGGGIHHTWGNHEFYNFSRDVLLEGSLNSNPNKDEGCSYYSFSPYPGFRVVVLDTYDFSVIGNCEGAPKHQQALTKLKACNPNEDLVSPDGMTGLDRRFSKVNGGVGDVQLAWLNDTMTSADQRHEHIIVMGHIPVYEPSTFSFCMLWNYDEVLKIFHQHPYMVAYLAGHDHDGGYAVDDHGIHHVTLRGMVEAVSPEDPTVTAHVYNKRLELHNLGPRVKPIDKVVIELKH